MTQMRLAVISPSVQVPITRGEIKAKTITYTKVVRELIPIGMWSGKAMTVRLHRHSIAYAGAERCAVLVQQGRGGPIVGAAAGPSDHARRPPVRAPGRALVAFPGRLRCRRESQQS